MNTEIKKYADSGDLKSLKYIFVDSLDVDPTFVRYKEEYDYCKSIPGLLEKHVELTPFIFDKTKWNETYWTNLKMDLIKNFSDQRMMHMRDVAKVFLADKIQRILEERATAAFSANEISKKSSVHESVSTPKKQPDSKVTEFEKANIMSRAEQNRIIEEDKKKLADEYKKQEEKARLENYERQSRAQNQEYDQNGDGISKKNIGIAVAAVIVIIVVLILLL